jgi:hypothetical protein
MRKTAGYTRSDYKNNLDVMKDLNTQPVMEFIDNYRYNWKTHVLRVPHSSIPFILVSYQPKGRRSLGIPFKRWQETVTVRWA